MNINHHYYGLKIILKIRKVKKKWNTKLIEEKPVVYLGVTIKQKLRDCV